MLRASIRCHLSLLFANFKSTCSTATNSLLIFKFRGCVDMRECTFTLSFVHAHYVIPLRGRSMNSISPVPLVYPQPAAGFIFLGVFADGKKNSGSACIDGSSLNFQSAVSFQIRLVAKKQAGPTRLFFCIPAVKPSEFTNLLPSTKFQPLQ